MYGLITLFTIYILANANHFIRADQIIPIITLFSYAFALGLYCIINKKQHLRYWPLFNASLAFLFFLYAITPIPRGHYSLYLMAFFVCMMHLGTLIHRKANFTEAKAFYWTGFLGLAIAPLYSVHQSNILLLLQALYALHFWEIHHEIKTMETGHQKKDRTCQVFNFMVYPLTIVSLALIIQQRFPISWNTIGTCLIFAFLYFKIAHDHQDNWGGKDLILVITGTIFFTIAYFTAIFLYLAPDRNPWVWLASAPIIWILLFMGWLYSKGEKNKMGIAIYRTQYLPMAIAFTIPFFLKRTNITVLLGLDLVFLLTYLLMYLKNRWWGFLYAFPLTLSYLYYLALHEAFLPTMFISPAFIFPGIIVISLALWFHSKTSRWNEIFFFWLYTLSFMALITLNSSHVSIGYSLALWGLLYLLISAFGNLPSKELGSYFLTIGHTLCIAAAVSILFFMNPQATLHVYLLIGIGYLIIYLVKKKEIYLYPIAISGSVSYYLFFLRDLRWDLVCLKAVPFLVFIYGIWMLMNRKQKKDSGIALKRIGHITAFLYTLMLIFNLSENQIGITILSLIIYAGIYFSLIIFRKTYDICFLAIGYITLIYFEALNISNSMALKIHLQLFILIMIPLVLFGYYFWKQKNESWAFPLLDLTVIISLVTTLVSLSQGFVWTTQVILIMSAVLFMTVSLFLKKDLYIFLTTLCLGLSAYNSLIAAKNIFVIDLVVYTVYALIFIGIFFFLPIFRRILNFKGPRYMIRAINWKSVLFYGSIGSVITFVFLFLYSLQLANFPGFCTKCHFMKPYAEAWEHSTHNEVNCVDCHYEPGIKPVIKGKINGLVSAVKYLTHTYSTKPHSEISDASCLRSGCHNKMDLHVEIVYKKGIYFNHEHHLKTLRRGKQLRCTTCHSQIVQGEHINVTESICFTCHFKSRDKEGVGIGRCMICHDNPIEPVIYHGVEFDHREFLEGKSDALCIDCHSGVTQGEGEVPIERCFSCHMEQDPDLSDSESLHLEHITKNKVECFECHLDIKHGIKAMAKQIKWDCNECHESSHTVAEKMYLGIGAKGVSGEPDPMFTAKVSCQGCHKYSETVKIGEISFNTTKANVQACDDCHGEGTGYTDLALEWQEDIRQMLEKVLFLRKELEKPIKLLKDKGASSQSNYILSIYEKAETNLLFVQADGSGGVHNYLYAHDLLEDIGNDFDRCLSLIEKLGSFKED
jgi:nitrate/TMAO reductase-like tetraheme cytochrome c subunit